MAQEKLTHIPSGWYSDPFGEHQLRWWDSHQWTEHTHEVEVEQAWKPSQVGTNYVPFAQSRTNDTYVHFVPTVYSTGSIWLIAILPAVHVAIALWLYFFSDVRDLPTIVATWAGFHVASLVLAVIDERILVHAAHTRTATALWALLGPLAYVIARTTRVVAQTHRGSGPLWTSIGVNIVVLMAVGLVLVLLP